MALEDTITRLVAAGRMSSDCYREASERLIDQPAIAHFFDEQADYHDLAANWLEQKLAEAGKRPVAEILESPPTEGWTRPSVNENNPKEIISACHASEELTTKVFELATQDLPGEWKGQIREYASNMRSALAKLHAWIENKEIGPDFG